MKEDEEEEQIIKNVPVLNKDELGKNPNNKNKITDDLIIFFIFFIFHSLLFYNL